MPGPGYKRKSLPGPSKVSGGSNPLGSVASAVGNFPSQVKRGSVSSGSVPPSAYGGQYASYAPSSSSGGSAAAAAKAQAQAQARRQRRQKQARQVHRKMEKQRKQRSGQDQKVVRFQQRQARKQTKPQPTKPTVIKPLKTVGVTLRKAISSFPKAPSPRQTNTAPTNTENSRRRVNALPNRPSVQDSLPVSKQLKLKQQKPQKRSQRPSRGLTKPLTKKPRKVAHRLEKAVSKQTVTNPSLGPDQTRFVNSLAKRTGLSPRVLAGMAASEQPADSPSIPGSQNWLNIGYFDSGPGGPTQDKRFFGSPEQAAKTTADFFKGKTLGASEGIQNILSTAGKSDAAQIKAIQNSGWASSGYPNLPELAAQSSSSKSVPKKLKRTARQTLGKKPTKAILKGGTVVKDPKAGEKDKPSKADQRWGGAVGAIHAVLPKKYWPDARGDKRTPAENAAVGGSPTSDHLTTNTNSFGADLPADDNLAKQIADKLGLPSHTGLQTIDKDGVRYQLIWQAEGHYDHVHLGAEILDPSKAPFASDPNVPIKGTKLAVKMPAEPSTGSAVSGAGTAVSGALSPSSGTSGSQATTAKGKKAQARRRRARRNYVPYADSPGGYYSVNPDDYSADPFLKRLAELAAQ